MVNTTEVAETKIIAGKAHRRDPWDKEEARSSSTTRRCSLLRALEVGTQFALAASTLRTLFIELFPSRLLLLAQQTLSALMGSFLQAPSMVRCKLA